VRRQLFRSLLKNTGRVAAAALGAVSLVLCVLSAVGAVRTQFVSEEWSYQTLMRHKDGSITIANTALISAGGCVEFVRTTILIRAPLASDADSLSWLRRGGLYARNKPSRSEPRFGRFDWDTQRDEQPDRVYQTASAEIPWWSLLIAACVLPGWWVLRRIKSRRLSKRGLCLTCGYDLRATPDRCPECGRVPPAAAPAVAATAGMQRVS
jgi:hypothetical protein